MFKVQEVSAGGLHDAKSAAASLKREIEKLSMLEKTAGAKYLKPVLELIRAVERI